MKAGTCQQGAVGCGGVMMLSRDPVAIPPHPRRTVAAVGAARDPTRGCEVVAPCLHDADVACCCTVVQACYAQRQQAASILATLELLLKRDVAKPDDVDDDDGGRGALHWLHAARPGFADSRKVRKAWQGCGS